MQKQTQNEMVNKMVKTIFRSLMLFDTVG